MANESECSKKFKKIADRSTALAKKETRIAKEYSKLWTNYSTINDMVSESTRTLNSLTLIARKKEQKVEALRQIEQERAAELKKVEKEVEVLQEKIKALHNNKSGFEKNSQHIEKLLKTVLLKICTKTYISDKNPHVIQGFTANTQNSKITPFEIDPGPKTKNEIEEELWEYSSRSSEHAKQWEVLFGSAE